MNYSELPLHPLSEELAELMATKTGSSDLSFFRVLIPYYWSLVAATMHAKIIGFDANPIMINYFGVSLAESGTGKGVSMNIMERQVLRDFKQVFLNETFPSSTNDNLFNIATTNAVKSGETQDAESAKLYKTFNRLGAPAVWFGEASSSAAIKQYRHKLLMANCGAINLTIDEIGVNLIGQAEALNLYLELYDHGMVKEKLTKSTADNHRDDIIEGCTPTNLLMFGSPASLMDGSLVEKRFMEMLEMGYARRCFFGYTQPTKRKELTVDEMFAQMRNKATDSTIEALAVHLGNIAKPFNLHKEILILDPEIKEILAYKLNCQQRADFYKANQTREKFEMVNRFFKVLKLAGAYAFIEGVPAITTAHIHNAIALAERSGEAFAIMTNPERPYVKLAKHLAENKHTEFTLADLEEDLTFFQGGRGQKDEMINLATAWGYTNGILVKKRFEQSILFLRADRVDETNTDEMIISYSHHEAYQYQNEVLTWNNLVALTQMIHPTTQGILHWTNHHMKNSHRAEVNAIQRFNMVVIDIDKGKSLDLVKILFKPFKHIIYTTKSHGVDGADRFRLILPISHILTLDAQDYKDFYNNVLTALPVSVTPDSQCGTRSKKWQSHQGGQLFVNEGELFNVIPLVPRTTKEVEYKERLKEYRNMDNLERWFVSNTGEGNRNNQLYKYAVLLKDVGHSTDEVSRAVRALNSKLADKLSDEELMNTIIRSVASKV